MRIGDYRWTRRQLRPVFLIFVAYRYVYIYLIYVGVGTYRGLQIDEEAAAAGISGPLLLPGISAASPQPKKKKSEREGCGVCG